jgi:hypothetical protein
MGPWRTLHTKNFVDLCNINTFFWKYQKAESWAVKHAFLTIQLWLSKIRWYLSLSTVISPQKCQSFIMGYTYTLVWKSLPLLPSRYNIFSSAIVMQPLCLYFRFLLIYICFPTPPLPPSLKFKNVSLTLHRILIILWYRKTDRVEAQYSCFTIKIKFWSR